jgi:hypothetical protein
MGDSQPRFHRATLRGPGCFEAAHGLGGGAGDGADVAGGLDRQRGLGDVDGDHGVSMDPAQGDLLAGDHDHPGVRRMLLRADRLERRASPSPGLASPGRCSRP